MGSPPPYAPISADAQPVADEQNKRVAALIAADSPPNEMPPTTPYEVASMDTILMARGIQLRDVKGLGTIAGSNAMGVSPAYVASPFGTVNFTPKVARQHWIETRLSMWVNAVGLVQFRLRVGGQSIVDPEASFFFNEANAHRRIDFLLPVTLPDLSLVAISWDWIGASGVTLNADANDIRILRVWT